jgi:ribosomal protein S18 acetylase RimI-like enzyme
VTAPILRPYRESDRDALYDVCVRTAAAGGDARGLYADDDLMPDLFAGPYVHLEPHLAFVVATPRRAVGYVVGTSDTPRFVREYRRVWIPFVGDRIPPPPPVPQTPEEQLAALHHGPERMLVPALAGYPAHLHINLLPEAQGRGYGRRLIDAFAAAAARAGARSMHLAMLTVNAQARGFYDRLGWQVIDVPDPGPLTYLWRATAP